MMKKVWRETFLMHSKLQSFKDLVFSTRENIKFILSKTKKQYVAYSGGKDSCVLLDLVLKSNPGIPCFHWDYGPNLIPRRIEYTIIENALRIGAQKFFYATSSKYLKKESYVWYKDFLEKELPKLARFGYDLSFIGLRAEESCKRAIRTKDLLSHDGFMLNAYPLRAWSYKDIYAYLLLNHIPYLEDHYDKYSALMGYKRSRFVTFFDPEFDSLGARNVDGILMYKHRNEDVEGF